VPIDDSSEDLVLERQDMGSLVVDCVLEIPAFLRLTPSSPRFPAMRSDSPPHFTPGRSHDEFLPLHILTTGSAKKTTSENEFELIHQFKLRKAQFKILFFSQLTPKIIFQTAGERFPSVKICRL